MQRLKGWVSRLSIKKKLIFYSYLCITPVLLIISVILFIKNYKDTVREMNVTRTQTVQGLSDSMEGLQSDMMDICTYICINNEISKILTSNQVQKLNQDTQLWVHKAPMEMLQDMVALKGYIKTIAIYPENGVTPYLRCIDATSYLGSIQMVRETKIYQKAVKEKGNVLWRYVNKKNSDTYEANRGDKIVLYREIYDLSKKNALGYLVIGASSDEFMNLCENAVSSDREGIVVFGPEGSLLLSYGMVDKEILQFLKEQSFPIFHKNKKTQHFSYRKSDIFVSQKKKESFVVYKIVPKEELGAQFLQIAYGPVALLLGFLVGLLPILIFVSNIISKPLKRLCMAMEDFKMGDFTQKIEVSTQDEMGEVAEGFNKMVVAIKSLIDTNYVMELKEKQSELTALQAQINPHFLYNTLDSLYWRAQEADNEEIAEDILELSNLFRQILGQGRGVISVKEEIELIRTYLHIQKMRFTKRLDYQIAVSEEILFEDIPKLVLQPFVENAIVHGFEKIGTPGFVEITGGKEGGFMKFCISDNGAGMTKEQVEGIFKEDPKRYSGQRIVSYAIKNVRERLELRYQNEFQLEIKSEEGKGTKIIIMLPLSKKEGV
ncbi:MAG: two-component system, sensor histidine kinase YesM [Clostridiales bacterium]|nr:two-component system, sensor histidine kinase YesM [Clostridiales bacterium]